MKPEKQFISDLFFIRLSRLFSIRSKSISYTCKKNLVTLKTIIQSSTIYNFNIFLLFAIAIFPLPLLLPLSSKICLYANEYDVNPH